MGAGHNDGRGENAVEPNASFYVFHNAMSNRTSGGCAIVRFKPSVKSTVGDFTEGVLVELDVGFPLGDVIKFASLPLVNGGRRTRCIS